MDYHPIGFYHGIYTGNHKQNYLYGTIPRHQLPWIVKAHPLLKDTEKLARRKRVRKDMVQASTIGATYHIEIHSVII